VRGDPPAEHSDARQWYSVLVHGETIASAGADHAYTAKSKGSQIAYEALRRNGGMKDLCDCRPPGTDIEDEPREDDDLPEEENLMEAELQRVFGLQ